MSKLRTLVLLACFLTAGVALHAQNTQPKKLTAAEAKDHVGEKAMVCGKVVSTRYAESSGGKPTFLNIDRPYPNHVFTVLIWGINRQKFGQPEKEFNGKRICVTGTITVYRGVAEIEADQPQQVKVESGK